MAYRYSNQHYGFTPRDHHSGSGIYFKHTYTRDLTERDNTRVYYTRADHKKNYEKENEKSNGKEAPVTKPQYQNFTRVANLPLVRVSYNAHILSTTTRTTLTQSFYHPGNAPIDEATYSFPLYAGCSVVSFVCHVGQEKIITGVVQPKKVAKATYEKAKSQGYTAGLLEEFTPEVFKTSLGNIPAGVTVRVEITYLTELKHDTKVDGIRFTVPTSIAPRYGDPPEGLFGDEYETRAEKGVSFSIDVTMGERIRTIESPSHGVSVELGTHKTTLKRRPNPANQHDDRKALVTLSQRSMHLSGDFILLITTATPRFLCTPMALLEAHPTIPGQQALMVTLVPRFAGPKNAPKREIIFIVDRSGSMDDMIAPLKSAISVFMKSLPIGCKFNICSFGSNYSFLWEKSQDYSAHTVKAALKLVEGFDAGMGGTELLKPVQETVKRRQEDMNTEVIVLTDGEIWGEDQVLGFIKQATGESKGRLRFFSIGLGSQVSHPLVEGIARTGGGYSQIVADGSDEQDKSGWEGKVVKMLKAALTEHVDHYSLKVIHEGFHETDEEDSDEEEPILPSAIAPAASNAGEFMTAPQVPNKLSFFDPNEDLDMAPGTPPSDDEFPVGRLAATANPGLSEDRFSHLKRLENPEILQAPYQIPPLYPQVRTVVYLLISPTGDRLLRNPTSVKLQGTASGIEMEQSIPITRLDEPGLTIHQLAARMALRDLEDGSSWLHSGKYGTNPKDDTFGEYVEREGEFLSIKWGLASKWASFVAVEDKFLKEATEKAAAAKANAKEPRGEDSSGSADGDDSDDDYALADGGPGAGKLKTTSIKTPVTDRPKHDFSALSLGGQPSAPIVSLNLVKAPPSMALAGKIPGAFSVMHAGHDSMSMLLQPRNEVADDDWNQLTSSHLPTYPAKKYMNSCPEPHGLCSEGLMDEGRPIAIPRPQGASWTAGCDWDGDNDNINTEASSTPLNSDTENVLIEQSQARVQHLGNLGEDDKSSEEVPPEPIPLESRKLQLEQAEIPQIRKASGAEGTESKERTFREHMSRRKLKFRIFSHRRHHSDKSQSNSTISGSGNILIPIEFDSSQLCEAGSPAASPAELSSLLSYDYEGESPLTSPNPSKNNTPRQKVIRIICLQEFIGSFPATEEMAHLIGLELPDVEKLAKELFPDKAMDESETLAMTSLVVAYLELEMHEHEDTWQMVVEKACEFVEEGCEAVEVLKEKAEVIIEKKVLKGDEEDLRVGDSARG